MADRCWRSDRPPLRLTEAPDLSSLERLPHRGRRSRTQRQQDCRWGMAAEELVARTYEDQGARIVGRRVRTKVGELDLVALEQDPTGESLVIVEVKARRHWDHYPVVNQRRIIAATEVFRSEHPHWWDAGVRWDVAMVDARGVVTLLVNAFCVDDCQALP